MNIINDKLVNKNNEIEANIHPSYFKLVHQGFLKEMSKKDMDFGPLLISKAEGLYAKPELDGFYLYWPETPDYKNDVAVQVNLPHTLKQTDIDEVFNRFKELYGVKTFS